MSVLKKIVINPGHGGGDPGAVGPTGLWEANINRLVAYQVEQGLRNLFDVRWVVQTRRGLAGLQEVINVANALEPVIFLSIHCNASWNRRAEGVQVYYKNEYSERLARVLFDNLTHHTKWSKVSPARYYVLKHSTASAAALIELDFISNRDREKLMVTPRWITMAAQAIVEGIYRYTGVERLP